MKIHKIAERAGSLAFIVFTIGALGVFTGMVVAMVFNPGEAGRATLVNWVAGSLVVSLMGAVLGSVADAAPVRKPSSDAERLAHLRIPTEAQQATDIPVRTTVAPRRVAVSAFRPELARR
ncbi:hypothetical protein L0V05_15370 [Tabrizicola sp. J26]|uniref:hypothetical protein n=1 Tax=Alitabrizicola rongguiensis TaxID=2909234 RepID=UPI001F3A4FD5|nr:hypothetical protein [Tabrizicola rongguiensis]MCF1710193.1 hypothetical protein [Tabrizicola rongguiensis]